ncbi:MAG TPA: metal ABC transporter permease [Acidimicrobiales bacterium]|nr:metal ABC transporter permease [Acidimicrobiales bacterium]
MTWLTEPLEFAFFRHGLIVATLAGALCGLIGVYVTLRGMSYIGHGLSHAIFGGFAASSLIGVNYLLGAGVWGLASALAIGAVTRRRPRRAGARRHAGRGGPVPGGQRGPHAQGVGVVRR